MSATSFHSKKGKVRICAAGGELADLPSPTSWTLAITTDTDDATPMSATNTGRAVTIGFSDWSATIDVYADLGDFTVAEGIDCDIEFWQDAGDATKGIFYGRGITTSVEHAQAAGTVKHSYSIEASNSDGNGLQWKTA